MRGGERGGSCKAGGRRDCKSREKSSPLQGSGEGARAPMRVGGRRMMEPVPLWSSSQHELLQQLCLRPGLEATSLNVVDGELRRRQSCCNPDNLGVTISLKDQESRWQSSKVGVLSIAQIPHPYS